MSSASLGGCISASSPFALPFELMPKRTIGSYSLLLGHIAHVNFDRELFRQKIKQVDIQIELPGELFQQVTTRRMALVVLDIVEVGA
jgi:hypothetical protein